MKLRKILTSKYTYILLIVLSVLAVVKTLLADYNLDEEYQVVMAYRHVHGDRLVQDMWEPHQTSAFICAGLIRLFLAVTGSTTGLVIFLRGCGTLIHLGVTMVVFRFLRKDLNLEHSALLALIYFNTVPKMIVLPEFGIMQFWFITLLWIFLFRQQAILSGLALCGVILCYPTSILLYPIVLWLLLQGLRQDRRAALRQGLTLTLTCAITGIVYTLILMGGQSLDLFITNVSHILGGDLTHSVLTNISGDSKLLSNLRDLGTCTMLLAAIAVLSAVITVIYTRIRKQRLGDGAQVFGLSFVLISLLTPLVYWFILKQGFESMHIHLLSILLVLPCFRQGRHKDNASGAERLLFQGVILGLAGLICIVMITDLTLLITLPHLVLASYAALCYIASAPDSKEDYSGLIILIAWCLVAVIGKGYSVRSGAEYKNVSDTNGLVKTGPAIGTVGPYMRCHMMDSNLKDWDANINDGDNVLIVIGTWWTDMTTLYLSKDVNISHYSVVDPAAYDERLLEYWRLHPDKTPDVIAIECWFGNPYIDTDSYIFRYIEDDFGYTTVNDGEYLRFYRR